MYVWEAINLYTCSRKVRNSKKNSHFKPLNFSVSPIAILLLYGPLLLLILHYILIFCNKTSTGRTRYPTAHGAGHENKLKQTNQFASLILPDLKNPVSQHADVLSTVRLVREPSHTRQSPPDCPCCKHADTTTFGSHSALLYSLSHTETSTAHVLYDLFFNTQNIFLFFNNFMMLTARFYSRTEKSAKI